MPDSIAAFLDQLQSDPPSAHPTEGAQRLDDVAWHHYTRYEYALEPRYLMQPPPGDPFAGPSPVLDHLVSESVPTGDLTAFHTLLFDQLNAKCYALADTLVHDYDYTKGRVVVHRLSDYGFEPATAVALMRQALDMSGGTEADLLELYWPLNASARFQMISDIAAALPPPMYDALAYEGQASRQLREEGSKWLGDLPGATQEESDLAMDLADLGVAGDPHAWLRKFVLGWSEVVAQIRSSYANPPATQTGSTAGASGAQALHGYPFEIFAPYSVNIGLRFLYRQEWRVLGTQIGELVKTVPLGPKESLKVSTKITRRRKSNATREQDVTVETSSETSDTTKDSSELANEASKSFGWHAEAEGSARWGWGSAKVSGGVKSDAEEKSKETSSRLAESMQKIANKLRSESKVTVAVEGEWGFERTVSSELSNPNEEIAITALLYQLQAQNAEFTGLADIDPFVCVAERVPTPSQVTANWVLQHNWLLSQALLDESYRDALNALTQAPATMGSTDGASLIDDSRQAMQDSITNVGTLAKNSGSLSLSSVDVAQEAQRSYQQAMREDRAGRRQDAEGAATRERLLAHIRANIFHYCQAVWGQEDPDQRILRYRRLGIAVPTKFEFVGTLGDTPGQWDINDLLALADVADAPPPELNGRFQPIADPSATALVADMIDPSAPVAFVANLAIFPIKRDYLRDDTFDMLHILLQPYLDPDRLAAAGGPRALQADPDALVSIIVDPEYLRIREQIGSLNAADLSQRVSDPFTRIDMVDTVPSLRLRYDLAHELDEDDNGGRVEALMDPAQSDFTPWYAEYVFRASRTQKLLLDTNNLAIDLRVGTVSILEPFKRSHRFLDVQKSQLELRQMALENERRRKRIRGGSLGDPEIDRLTVIARGGGKKMRANDGAGAGASNVLPAPGNGGGGNVPK